MLKVMVLPRAANQLSVLREGVGMRVAMDVACHSNHIPLTAGRVVQTKSPALSLTIAIILLFLREHSLPIYVRPKAKMIGRSG